jgi:triacylglycerol lipase
MSFLVELPRETYPDDALDGFTVTSDFTPQNAQAMMWLSQLAYETAHRGKVDEILTAFKLKMRAFGTNDRITGLPPRSACFIVAGGRGATFVTFAGTDPLKIQAWITDFTVALEPNVLHKGFADAVETVWPVIEAAIRNRGAAEQPLFFTGHSMGAALATLAAARALQAGFRASAVYTFGGPRVGAARRQRSEHRSECAEYRARPHREPGETSVISRYRPAVARADRRAPANDGARSRPDKLFPGAVDNAWIEVESHRRP